MLVADRKKARRSHLGEKLRRTPLIGGFLYAVYNAWITRRVAMLLPPVAAETAEKADPKAPSLARLGGILSYVAHVKRSDEDTSVKGERGSVARLYRQFLIFRHFHVNEKPTIITEGPTDVVYLKAAIRNLVADYPALAEIKDGVFKLKVKFLKSTKSVVDVLGLSGGTDPIKKLILEYGDQIDAFGAAGGSQPVIVIIDNDSGATGLYGAVGNKFKKTFTVAAGVAATRVVRNLYLVSTPASKGGGQSCIEDCFDKAALSTKLGGKSFHYATNTIDDATQYGKVRFADNVVLPNQKTIDFNGFRPVLDQLVSAISAHKTSTPAVTAKARYSSAAKSVT